MDVGQTWLAAMRFVPVDNVLLPVSQADSQHGSIAVQQVLEVFGNLNLMVGVFIVIVL